MRTTVDCMFLDDHFQLRHLRLQGAKKKEPVTLEFAPQGDRQHHLTHWTERSLVLKDS